MNQCKKCLNQIETVAKILYKESFGFTDIHIIELKHWLMFEEKFIELAKKVLKF